MSLGPAPGREEGARASSPHPSFLCGYSVSLPPAPALASLPLAFFEQQPRHYCKRFIFRVKATELQIRQGLKQMDKRAVCVFGAV